MRRLTGGCVSVRVTYSVDADVPRTSARAFAMPSTSAMQRPHRNGRPRYARLMDEALIERAIVISVQRPGAARGGSATSSVPVLPDAFFAVEHVACTWPIMRGR